jgi:peptidase E
MNRRDFLQTSTIAALGVSTGSLHPIGTNSDEVITKKIFLTGGGYDLNFINYLISLTGKPKPNICFLPTPVGDSDVYIKRWYETARALPIQPFVQKVFINAAEQTDSFENLLLDMDAILVPGGNTLNTIALWKAQGIDIILQKAWEKGIVLSGASAGALCWFEQGLSDSRPKELTVVEGLGFLKGSNCPHYHSEANRKETYKRFIHKGGLKPGYACDDLAGLYFENDTLTKVLSTNKENKAYKLNLIDGAVVESVIEPTLIQ